MLVSLVLTVPPSHENIEFYILVEDFRQYWDVMDEVMRKKSAEVRILL